METTLEKIKNIRKKLSILYDELEIALELEQIKQKFPNGKIYASVIVFNGKTYKIEFIGFNEHIKFTKYMKDYLLIVHNFGETSTQLKMFFKNNGKLSKSTIDELKKFKILKISKW